MAKTSVIGHKAPDTDSVCSAIAMAWVLGEEGRDAEAFVAGTPNKEALFVLDHFGVSLPQVKNKTSESDELVIVDTNNPEELIDGTENATIVEIIDHHKLSGLKTDSPARVTIEPLGCTATLIYKRAIANKSSLPKDIAGLLLSAIVSDTLKFTSPTTTDEDKETALKLAAVSGENIDSLAEEMFRAKSDLTGMSTEDILLSDSKVFELNTSKARVSVLETTKPDNAKAMATDLKATIDTMKKSESLDAMYFFIIDILEGNAYLLVSSEGEKTMAKKAFDAEFDGDFMKLSGVVSRKKQIIPSLEKAYA